MDFGTKIDPPVPMGIPQPAIGKNNSQSVKKAAEAFESYLLGTILQEFAKATQMTKKSYAEETQMSLFYEKVADIMAKKGIGLKEMLSRYAERGAKVSGKNGENKISRRYRTMKIDKDKQLQLLQNLSGPSSAKAKTDASQAAPNRAVKRIGQSGTVGLEGRSERLKGKKKAIPDGERR